MFSQILSPISLALSYSVFGVVNQAVRSCKKSKIKKTRARSSQVDVSRKREKVVDNASIQTDSSDDKMTIQQGWENFE